MRYECDNQNHKIYEYEKKRKGTSKSRFIPKIEGIRRITAKKKKLKGNTSGARETGKAMVRDSERAGESQKTEKRAADAAANPKQHRLRSISAVP